MAKSSDYVTFASAIFNLFLDIRQKEWNIRPNSNTFFLFLPLKMKRFVRYIGLMEVGLGILLYLLAFLFKWTTSNSVMIIALLLVVGGVITHVMITKHTNKY